MDNLIYKIAEFYWHYEDIIKGVSLMIILLVILFYLLGII
jgi:hypothetical protein